MRDQLSGPCCVLRAAMSYDRVPDRLEEPESGLFQALVAAVGAIGFVALFIL